MDTWDEGADYENYMGRWGRPMARQSVSWLDVPNGARWLDVGCGTGAPAGRSADDAHRAHLAGIDPSPSSARAARKRLGGEVDTRIGDAQSLPFAAPEFDVTASAIALNFAPDPGLVVRELQRVTAGGGVVAAYVWDHTDGMQMIRRFWDAAVALKPNDANLDEAARFPLRNPESLSRLFEDSGLGDVALSALEIPTVFGSLDEYWEPIRMYQSRNSQAWASFSWST